MAVSNPSKKKGSSFETLIANYLKQEWSELVERMPLTGANDKGDIANFRIGDSKLLALECKNVKAMRLSEWVKEAQREAENYGAVAGAVIHKRKQVGAPGEQFVTMTLSDFLTILHAAAL